MAGGSQDCSDHKQVAAQLAARVARWQAVVDDIKLQIHLGPREIRDRVEAFLAKVDLDLHQAKTSLAQLDKSDERGRKRLCRSLEQTLNVLEESFEQIRRSSEPRER